MMRKLLSPAALFVSLLIVTMTGCGGGGGSGGTASAPAGLAPTVVSDTPAALPSSAALSPRITATFSENMKASSINGTTFTLTGPMGATVSGTVSYANRVATFTLPTNTLLAANTPYTAMITVGATATNGKPMAVAFPWNFTTGAAPTVSFTNPTMGATNVLLNQHITATFSEPMKAFTIIAANFSVVGASALNGSVSYDATNNTAIFTPQTPLTAGDS
ncbi:MAG TPA: Ig-like domain-containing protein, partial [Candidatus Binataceae bacterium]|nr:Ig-like domain-containing protein [Candidatus Binataceae bacterium]